MCPCGYVKECPIWCGNGHRNGKCPPFIANNDVTPPQRPPKCTYCHEVAPYGDARNNWITLHNSKIHIAMQQLIHGLGYAKGQRSIFEKLKNSSKQTKK